MDVLLLMAASENDVPKVEELLGAGANINITDSKGKSPLELATKPEVVELLEVCMWSMQPAVEVAAQLASSCVRTAESVCVHRERARQARSFELEVVASQSGLRLLLPALLVVSAQWQWQGQWRTLHTPM